jgi:hypothetical protein
MSHIKSAGSRRDGGETSPNSTPGNLLKALTRECTVRLQVMRAPIVKFYDYELINSYNYPFFKSPTRAIFIGSTGMVTVDERTKDPIRPHSAMMV